MKAVAAIMALALCGCRLATPEFKTGPQTNSTGGVYVPARTLRAFPAPPPLPPASAAPAVIPPPVNTNTAAFAWDAPTNTEGLMGYLLSQGGESGIYTNEISLGVSETEWRVPVVPGDTYFFAVRSQAAFSGLASEFSNELEYRLEIVEPPQPPEPSFTTREIITDEILVLGGSSSGAWNAIFTNIITTTNAASFYRLRFGE